MEIQQHDSVVVDVAGLGRASPSICERERCSRGGGRRPRLLCCCPPSPPLYRPPGGDRPWDPIYGGGGGQGGKLAPQARWGAPHPRVSNPRHRGEAHGGRPSPLRAGSLPTSAHGALRDRWPHPMDPGDPSGGPGTIPVTSKLVLMAEIALPIYNSLPPDHSGTPRDVRDLIRDPEQHSGYCIYLSSQP